MSNVIPAHDGKGTSDASDDAACFSLFREMWNLPVIARFTIDGEPVSKARARFTKQGSKVHSYTPEKTKQAEHTVAWKFRQAAPNYQPDSDATYGVMALFFNGTRQRRDVDNMLKLILDGLNGVAWPDDTQVVEVSGRKTLDSHETARTEVLIYQVGKIERPTKKCEHCGKEFPSYPSQQTTMRQRRFCGRDCGYAWRRAQNRRECLACGKEFQTTPSKGKVYCSTACRSNGVAVEVECAECGTKFTKPRSKARYGKSYCGPECHVAYARKRRAKAAYGICGVCGETTTRKEYRRCNACRVAGRKLPDGEKDPTGTRIDLIVKEVAW